MFCGSTIRRRLATITETRRRSLVAGITGNSVFQDQNVFAAFALPIELEP
jgi:hypothetical protein